MSEERNRLINLCQTYIRDRGYQVTFRDAAELYGAIEEAMRKMLLEGGQVRILNVCTLKPEISPGRFVRSFDGTQLYSPAHYYLSFRTAQGLSKDLKKIPVTEKDI